MPSDIPQDYSIAQVEQLRRSIEPLHARLQILVNGLREEGAAFIPTRGVSQAVVNINRVIKFIDQAEAAYRNFKTTLEPGKESPFREESV